MQSKAAVRKLTIERPFPIVTNFSNILQISCLERKLSAGKTKEM